MNKLTAIRIKYDDGTYSDEIPVSTLAEYIFWDDSHNLVDILGTVDINTKGSIQNQINRLFAEKIDEDQLDNYLASQISEDVTGWLNDNVTPVGSAVVVDSSLTVQGAAADAKVTGDKITEIKEDLSEIEPGLSDEAKQALLACFAKVAWVDEHGQSYYDTLENALYPGQEDYPNIKATLDGVNVFYTDDTLDNVKDCITVKYYETSESSGTIIQKSDYQLTGTLTSGISTLTVIYDGLSAFIRVNVYDATLPSGYTAYNYIATSSNSSGDSIQTVANALIGLGSYNDVNHVSLKMDLYPTHNISQPHKCVLGTRSSSACSDGASIYIRGSDNAYLVYSHTNSELVFSNAFTKDAINHIELIVGNESPTIFKANGTKHEITWQKSTSLMESFYLFANTYTGVTGTLYLSRYFQIGRIATKDGSGNIDIFIPALRASDNVVGLYNITKDTFVTCQSVAYATVGNSNCIYKVGNWN